MSECSKLEWFIVALRCCLLIVFACLQKTSSIVGMNCEFDLYAYINAPNFIVSKI